MIPEELQVVEKLRNKLFETFTALAELSQSIEDSPGIDAEIRSKLKVDAMLAQAEFMELQDLLEELANVPVSISAATLTMLGSIFKGKRG